MTSPEYNPPHLRLTLLQNISTICDTSTTGHARWLDIHRAVNRETGQRKLALAVMLRGLVNAGWVDRPFRGSYRVTMKGRLVLEKWMTSR